MTDTDISPEAVEALAKYSELAPGYVTETLRALSAALTLYQNDANHQCRERVKEWERANAADLALTQSRAETAAAYAIATHELDKWAVNLRDMNFPETAPIVEQCSAMIRALTTPEQSSALAAVEAAAEARGMRMAAEIADAKYAAGDMGNPGHHILAAIPQGEV